jgi:hypothetical protein
MFTAAFLGTTLLATVPAYGGRVQGRGEHPDALPQRRAAPPDRRDSLYRMTTRLACSS